MFSCADALLAGCEEETTLYARLEERQANLVMAALLDAGISCHKAPGDEGTWDVTVVESRFADAVNLLNKAGLPRNDHMGIGEVFKKTGMISSPSEERIRFMDALAQDLAKTIAGIIGLAVMLVLLIVLGILSMMNPSITAFAIGTMMGLNVLFAGINLISTACAA